VVVGIAPFGQDAPIDPFTLVLQEKALLGSFYGSSRPRVDMLRLLDLYGQGRLKLDELITRTYRLEQINEAYADLVAGGPGRGMILLS
jgi:S-(hydroxymethyl)glutathione dehydrogenase/alcohol dehydrogenase